MQIAALRAAIVDHPWRTLGFALIAGACVGVVDAQRSAGRPTLLRILVSELVRDLAKGEAVSWLDARIRPFTRGDASADRQHRGPVEPARA